MKKIFLLIGIVALTMSCMKVDDDYELTLEQLEKQANADDEAIIEFMKARKLIFDEDADKYANNINWKVEELKSTDPESTESLFDLMSENVIEYIYEGITFKLYYYNIGEGSGDSPEVYDRVLVDYKAYNMPDNLIDFSQNTIDFTLSRLIAGWQIALPNLKAGSKPEGFPLFCEGCNPYREQVESPGKALLLIPSSLAYGNGKPMMFDIVLYDVVKN